MVSSTPALTAGSSSTRSVCLATCGMGDDCTSAAWEFKIHREDDADQRTCFGACFKPLPERPQVRLFYPQNYVGRGWGIRNSATGAARLPKIPVLKIDDFVSPAQGGIMSKCSIM